jgi:hypothetical protein
LSKVSKLKRDIPSEILSGHIRRKRQAVLPAWSPEACEKSTPSMQKEYARQVEAAKAGKPVSGAFRRSLKN